MQRGESDSAAEVGPATVVFTYPTNGVPGGSLTGSARCVVPNVVGRTLPRAKRALAAAHCRLGRIGHVHRGRRGRVTAERPRLGSSRAALTKVNLTLGR